jgi:hypothetical protein
VTPTIQGGEGRRSRARTGILLLLAASEAVGLALGQWFFGIYTQTVPPAVVTSFNVNAAHGYFLLNGALAGLLFFIWGLLVMWLGPFFRAGHAGASYRES